MQKTTYCENEKKTPKNLTNIQTANKAKGLNFCTPCNRNFTSESRLNQHYKTKHNTLPKEEKV